MGNGMVYDLEADMTMGWEESWTEIWSTGHGRDRSYCGIAATEEGYAVDVFQGDTCVASSTFERQSDAERAAHALFERYCRITPTFASTPHSGWVARAH